MLLVIKRMNFCHLHQRGETEGNYVKWTKSGTERQILCVLTFMWKLKFDLKEGGGDTFGEKIVNW
jgi:hypothetical protein